MTLAGRRVLLGVTGGIAAYKSAHLARLLAGAGADVTVVMTASATRFVGEETFAALTGRPVHTSLWGADGDIVHVRLAHDADLVVVAPASADAIARAALGLADDLLAATLLEYRGPLVIAPAMHTGMWEHEATQANVATLRARGVEAVGPVAGSLAHGDEGIGRMAEPEAIAEAAAGALEAVRGDLTGRVVVVTAGPTHEAIDPVRFLGNRSSGKMGVAIAAEASRRGADVQLVLGPGTVAPPAGVHVERVTSAEEMRAAVFGHLAHADAVVMAAAVADFRPKAPAPGKLKKVDGPPDIVLEPAPDILRELGEERRAGLVLVGFAAETDDVEDAGRRKLATKRADLIVANEVGLPDTGFGSDTNRAAILDANGGDVAMRSWTKAELAAVIVDRVVGRLG